MITGQALFDQYCEENPQLVSSGKLKNKFIKVNKDRFVKYASKAQSGFEFEKHSTRHRAKKYMVSQFGPIEWFFFKTIIMWIIEKILYHYFGPESTISLPRLKIDGRVL